MIKFSRVSGFTTIELIIGIAISSFLISALLRFMVVGFPLSRVTYQQNRSTETARVQLKRLAKAIRELRAGDNGAYALAEASPEQVIFYSNIDGDSATERVRYHLNGTNLERGITKPSGSPLTYNLANEVVTVVATSIRNGANPIFIYYNGNYPAVTTPLTPTDLTEVKYIQFSLTIDIDPAVDPDPVVVQSQVQLRNLKTNL